MSDEHSEKHEGSKEATEASIDAGSEVDLLEYYEKRAGSLVVDPEEAKVEFGDAVASRLKLSEDGTKVLWPQPTDSPHDPQNWSDRLPDFDSGIGIAAIFALAEQFNTTPNNINSSSQSPPWYPYGLYGLTPLYHFLLSSPRYDFKILALAFLIGCTFAPNLRTFTGLGSMYGAVVCVMIILFMEETMYDRHLRPVPEPGAKGGIRYRLESLVGITGFRMAKYRTSWKEAIFSPFYIVWRPHLLGILVFEAMVFGFSIGINVTNAVFLGLPPPQGFGWSQLAIAGGYGTPIVAVLIGEFVGRYNNDFIMNTSIRRNKGVFIPESRLWACYLAMPLYICGFVTLGAAVQERLTTGALIMGWGIAELAVMINTVAVYAYCNDCFPKQKGEISALINLARTLGGFSVAYFQVPWAEKNGALQTFGVEAAIVVGLFILIVPALQIFGQRLRERFST
ncbi:hypothetical protein VNI00_013530 [Paramarasmius palmivorus]|uniref:MFS general substrate transporter n=1 Tax=Paramarasmius palmivorus TaxID=297713 RepID=A0AAW0BWG7_9AGAR